MVEPDEDYADDDYDEDYADDEYQADEDDVDAVTKIQARVRGQRDRKKTAAMAPAASPAPAPARAEPSPDRRRAPPAASPAPLAQAEPTSDRRRAPPAASPAPVAAAEPSPDRRRARAPAAASPVAPAEPTSDKRRAKHPAASPAPVARARAEPTTDVIVPARRRAPAPDAAPAPAAPIFPAPAVAASSSSKMPFLENSYGGGEGPTTRQRSRRLDTKKPTPSLPNLHAHRASRSADPLRLPGIGGAASEVTVIDQSELLASEQLSVAVSAEIHAQEHLRRVRARVQRELRKATSLSALASVRERKQQIADEMRQDLDKRVGRDVTAKFRAEDVPKATEDEVRHVSELLNQRLQDFHPDARNFFALFKVIDIDGSRRISYDELHSLIRKELKVPKSEVPEARLHALWQVLDENASGFIDAGELSRFMRIGRPKVGEGSRVKMVLEKKQSRKDVRDDQARRSGMRLTQHLVSNDVQRASEEEVKELSNRFNAQMTLLRPREATNGNNFYRLFKHMDLDDSGRVSFKEFASMVRHELALAKADVPTAKLMGLWRSLDENESGYICIGEFGRFMRLSADTAPIDPTAEARERQRAADSIERARNSAIWKARAARRAHASAKNLAAEAAALEAALAAATAANAAGGGGGARALPPINGKASASEMLKRANRDVNPVNSGGNAAAIQMLKRASSQPRM